MRGSFTLSAGALAALVIVACANATGDVTPGAELYDAAPPPAPVAICNIERGSGATWTDLYRDFFGPNNQPGSCSFRANCHGTTLRGGLLCGADKDACYASMTRDLTPPEKKDTPDTAALFSIIRMRSPVDGSLIGIMPQEPNDCAFSDVSVKRIKAWIAKGAPND